MMEEKMYIIEKNNNPAVYCRSAIVVMETNVCMYPEYSID